MTGVLMLTSCPVILREDALQTKEMALSGIE
jgi:hypothetical protein